MYKFIYVKKNIFFFYIKMMSFIEIFYSSYLIIWLFVCSMSVFLCMSSYMKIYIYMYLLYFK